MVHVQSNATDLEGYYADLVAGQCAAHGADYCAHHEVIRRLAPQCCSYCEVGVNQGATLACAILAGFEWVYGVELHPEPFLEFEALFWAKARASGTKLEMFYQDHLAPLGRPVDMLFLDCDHTAKGLRDELKAHGDMVRRFILIHDTAANPELHVAACVYATAHDWTVHSREARGYGWTLLSRNP